MGLYHYTNSSYQKYSFLRHYGLLATAYIILNITLTVNDFQCLLEFDKSAKKRLYQINCFIQYSHSFMYRENSNLITSSVYPAASIPYFHQENLVLLHHYSYLYHLIDFQFYFQLSKLTCHNLANY